MPDPTEQVVTPPADGAAPVQTDQADEAYLLSFKTRADAEKGVKDFQAKATRAEQEAAELRKKLQDAETAALVRREIEAQAQATAEAKGTNVADERAKLRAKLSANLGDDAAEDVLSIAEKQYSASASLIEAKTKQLEAKLAEVNSRLADVQVRQSAAYQQNQQAIDALAQELNIPTAKAVAAFERMAQTVQFVPQGAPLPGTTATSRPAAGGNGSPQKLRAPNAQETARMKAMGWRDVTIQATKVDAEGNFV